MLTIEPDLSNKLLAGRAPLYQVKPITTGIKAIDKMGLLEVSWYAGQIKRIDHGKAPKPKEPGLWVFITQAWGMLRAGKKKRRPAKLRAR